MSGAICSVAISIGSARPMRPRSSVDNVSASIDGDATSAIDRVSPYRMRSGALNAIRPCTSSPSAESTSSNLSAIGVVGGPPRPPRPNPLPPLPLTPRPGSTGGGAGRGGGGGAGPGGGTGPAITSGGVAWDEPASGAPNARKISSDAPTSTRSTNSTATIVRGPEAIRTGTVVAARGWLQDRRTRARATSPGAGARRDARHRTRPREDFASVAASPDDSIDLRLRVRHPASTSSTLGPLPRKQDAELASPRRSSRSLPGVAHPLRCGCQRIARTTGAAGSFVCSARNDTHLHAEAQYIATLLTARRAHSRHSSSDLAPPHPHRSNRAHVHTPAVEVGSGRGPTRFPWTHCAQRVRETDIHAPNAISQRAARLCGRSCQATCLRRRGCAVQHAMANDCGCEGEGQGRAERLLTKGPVDTYAPFALV